MVQFQCSGIVRFVYGGVLKLSVSRPSDTMWQHVFESRTDVPIEQLWKVLADIPGWPEVDKQIQSIDVDGVPKLGTTFRLKPKGGPTLSMTVDRFDPPNTYADICSMPLAKMRTTHELLACDSDTQIRVTIEIFGPLSFLWSRIVGRKHANGLAAQTDLFVARAKSLGKSPIA